MLEGYYNDVLFYWCLAGLNKDDEAADKCLALIVTKSALSTQNTPVCFIRTMYLLVWVSYNNSVSFSKFSSD